MKKSITLPEVFQSNISEESTKQQHDEDRFEDIEHEIQILISNVKRAFTQANDNKGQLIEHGGKIEATDEHLLFFEKNQEKTNEQITKDIDKEASTRLK